MLGKNLIQAAAGNAGGAGGVLGVEDVFSTWLYTGNGSTQTITNGIDLAGEGGLTWIKARSVGNSHVLHDTVRGAGKRLITNSAAAQSTETDEITAFLGNGFTLGSGGSINSNGQTFASWTFRKAEKFFDVVTYTGTGSNQVVSHNLGAVPGFMIVKRLDASGDWIVYHRSLAATEHMVLNDTAAASSGLNPWNYQHPYSGEFVVRGINAVNASGGTYVAYLFAHDAGGFGDDETESVIKCGSFSYTGGTPLEVNLGWEAQWVLVKKTSGSDSWFLVDTMRGMIDGDGAYVQPNTSNAEGPYGVAGATSTGFIFDPGTQIFSSGDFIYIAIRRGPMKKPTDATKVFSTQAITKSSSPTTVTTNFVVDFVLFGQRNGSSVFTAFDRLRGKSRYLTTSATDAEATIGAPGVGFESNVSYTENFMNNTPVLYNLFRRAPGFFDAVTYTGTGVARTVPHNLGVAPEWMIIIKRNDSSSRTVYYGDPARYIYLDSDFGLRTSNGVWNNTQPTDTSFTVGIGFGVNESSYNYIAYLFATLPGISKVGSYTGTGTTLNVNCGFASGARFVLIKRTDSTGDWYVWDTARGIVSGNDPYLLLNSQAAEVTSTDYIDPLSSGFQISSTAPAAINASGGSYIFLAIA